MKSGHKVLKVHVVDIISALKLVNIDRITLNMETNPDNIREKRSNAEFCGDYKLKKGGVTQTLRRKKF